MRVLLIGDSHTVGPYGNALVRLFQQAGAEVVRVAHVGANAGNYLPGGKYASEVPKASFDLAIITLGTNDACMVEDVPAARTAARLKAIADALDARQVWYVGPPAVSAAAAAKYGAPGVLDLNTRSAKVFDAAKAVFGDRAIDPRPATAPFVSQSDIHLGAQGGAAWAQVVFDHARGAVGPKGASLPVFPAVLALGLVILWRRL